MIKIDQNLDESLYLAILNEDLHAIIDEYGINKEKVLFQQDNDPKHTASNVKEWLANQTSEVMNWPPQSPDLNPIENMWALLKLYRDYDRPPKGMNDHWERIHQTWYNITMEECQRVIETMH